MGSSYFSFAGGQLCLLAPENPGLSKTICSFGKVPFVRGHDLEVSQGD